MNKGDKVKVVQTKHTSKFFGVTENMIPKGGVFTVQEIGEDEGILYVKDSEGYIYDYYEVELVKEDEDVDNND